MGGLFKTKPIDTAKIADIDPDQTATTESGLRIPYFFGRYYAKLIALDQPARNRFSKEKTIEKGGKGAPDVKETNWFGDQIFAFGLGPASELRQLRLADDPLLTTPVVRSGGENRTVKPLPSVADGAGGVVVYWGTEAQTMAAPYSDHPGYRGIVTVVLDRFFLGKSANTMPDVSAEFVRGPWFDHLVSGHPFGAMPVATSDQGANAISGLLDFILHPRLYFGIPVERIHAASWIEVAQELEAATVDGYGGKPFHFCHAAVNGRAATQFVQTVLASAGCFLRVNAAGQLEVGRYPHTASITLPALTTLTKGAYEGKAPRSRPPSRRRQVVRLTVKYRDAANNWKEDRYTAGKGTRNPQEWKADFIVDKAQAIIHGEKRASILRRGLAELAGGKIRAPRFVRPDGERLEPGDLFYYAHDNPEKRRLYRISQYREQLLSGLVDLRESVEEPMYKEVPYTFPGDPPPDRTPEPVANLAHARILEILDTRLGPIQTSALVLVERPAADVSGFTVALAEAEGADVFGRFSSFAVRGTYVGSGVETINGADETVLKFSFPDAPDLNQVGDPENPELTLADGEHLIAVGDELIAVGAMHIDGATGERWFYGPLRRGVYGTYAQDHTAGDEAWFTLRRSTPVISSARLLELSAWPWRLLAHAYDRDSDPSTALTLTVTPKQAAAPDISRGTMLELSRRMQKALGYADPEITRVLPLVPAGDALTTHLVPTWRLTPEAPSAATRPEAPERIRPVPVGTVWSYDAGADIVVNFTADYRRGDIDAAGFDPADEGAVLIYFAGGAFRALSVADPEITGADFHRFTAIQADAWGLTGLEENPPVQGETVAFVRRSWLPALVVPLYQDLSAAPTTWSFTAWLYGRAGSAAALSLLMRDREQDRPVVTLTAPAPGVGYNTSLQGKAVAIPVSGTVVDEQGNIRSFRVKAWRQGAGDDQLDPILLDVRESATDLGDFAFAYEFEPKAPGTWVIEARATDSSALEAVATVEVTVTAWQPQIDNLVGSIEAGNLVLTGEPGTGHAIADEGAVRISAAEPFTPDLEADRWTQFHGQRFIIPPAQFTWGGQLYVEVLPRYQGIDGVPVVILVPLPEEPAVIASPNKAAILAGLSVDDMRMSLPVGVWAGEDTDTILMYARRIGETWGEARNAGRIRRMDDLETGGQALQVTPQLDFAAHGWGPWELRFEPFSEHTGRDFGTVLELLDADGHAIDLGKPEATISDAPWTPLSTASVVHRVISWSNANAHCEHINLYIGEAGAPKPGEPAIRVPVADGQFVVYFPKQATAYKVYAVPARPSDREGGADLEGDVTEIAVTTGSFAAPVIPQASLTAGGFACQVAWVDNFASRLGVIVTDTVTDEIVGWTAFAAADVHAESGGLATASIAIPREKLKHNRSYAWAAAWMTDEPGVFGDWTTGSVTYLDALAMEGARRVRAALQATPMDSYARRIASDVDHAARELLQLKTAAKLEDGTILTGRAYEDYQTAVGTIDELAGILGSLASYAQGIGAAVGNFSEADYLAKIDAMTTATAALMRYVVKMQASTGAAQAAIEKLDRLYTDESKARLASVVKARTELGSSISTLDDTVTSLSTDLGTYITRTETLESKVDDPVTGNTALKSSITNESSTRASADSAMASDITSLEATRYTGQGTGSEWSAWVDMVANAIMSADKTQIRSLFNFKVGTNVGGDVTVAEMELLADAATNISTARIAASMFILQNPSDSSDVLKVETGSAKMRLSNGTDGVDLSPAGITYNNDRASWTFDYPKSEFRMPGGVNELKIIGYDTVGDSPQGGESWCRMEWGVARKIDWEGGAISGFEFFGNTRGDRVTADEIASNSISIPITLLRLLILDGAGIKFPSLQITDIAVVSAAFDIASGDKDTGTITHGLGGTVLPLGITILCADTTDYPRARLTSLTSTQVGWVVDDWANGPGASGTIYIALINNSPNHRYA